MMTSTTPDCLSDLRATQVDAEELPAMALSAARRHAAGCVRCAALLDEVASERIRFVSSSASASFLQRMPDLAASSTDDLAARRAGRVRRVVAIASVALAVAGVLLVVVGRRATSTAVVDGDGTQTKGAGALHLGVFVKHGAAIRRGQIGERVTPGDQLRFELRGAAGAHVAVLALDGAGAASVFYPQTTATAPLTPSPDDLLPVAIELDQTLGDATLFAVACPTAIDLEQLRGALAHERSLRAPAGCHLDALSMVVEPARPRP